MGRTANKGPTRPVGSVLTRGGYWSPSLGARRRKATASRAAARAQRRSEPVSWRCGAHSPGHAHAHTCRNRTHGTKAGKEGHTFAASSPHSETRRRRTSTRTGKTSRERDFERWGAHGHGSGARITCTTTSRHNGQNADTEGATSRRDATAFTAAWTWPWYATVRSGQDKRAQPLSVRKVVPTLTSR
jgi:hypothetical protein